MSETATAPRVFTIPDDVFGHDLDVRTMTRQTSLNFLDNLRRLVGGDFSDVTFEMTPLVRRAFQRAIIVGGHSVYGFDHSRGTDDREVPMYNGARIVEVEPPRRTGL